MRLPYDRSGLVKTCPQCRMRYPNEATYCFVEGADLIAFLTPDMAQEAIYNETIAPKA